MITITQEQIIGNKEIGRGSFSEVRLIKLKSKIENLDTDEILIKKSINGKLEIDKTIEIHKNLKKQGAKTLEVVEKITLENEYVLLVENLNNTKDIVYVSPNTKILDLEKHELLAELEKMESFKATQNKHLNSEAEVFRSENLLSNLLNFKEDLEKYISEISSIKNIILFTDCFFFSSSKISKHTKIDYKIADFDCIDFTDEDYYYNSANVIQFLSSYSEFISKYLEESEDKTIYLNYLKTKIEEYKNYQLTLPTVTQLNIK